MDEQLIYLAGFLDGEGSIAIGVSKSPQGRRRWYLRVSCHQVVPAPLHMLRDRFGGSILKTAKHGNQRSIYEWVATCAIAADAIRALRPHLVVKAEEADLALAFQDELDARAKSHHPKRRLTDDEESSRESYYRQLREIKRRAYDEA